MNNASFTAQDNAADEIRAGFNSFRLPEIMTIETAEMIAAQLALLSLDGKTDFTLDASQVENITTPGIQIIVSLQKTLALQGGTLRVDSMRPLFVQAFADTGFENLLH